MKQYRIEGTSLFYKVPDNACVLCEHCTDIYWDYTNGPYGIVCEVCGDPGELGGCEQFIEDKENMKG